MNFNVTDSKLNTFLSKYQKIVQCVVLRAPVRKKQTYRGKGGKFDLFHISMLDRLGYNYNYCMFFGRNILLFQR